MHIRKSLWLFIFLLGTLSWAKAERIFVLFDDNCMDRLEYKQVSQPGSYIVYQINVAPGERILLEVGQEGGEYRGNMPTPVIGCSTGIFDARMVENINRGIDEVFVINPLPNGRHTITQVSMAGEYQYNQRILAFDSPKYDFRFDLENGTVGENIAVPSTQREVFFEGRMEQECLGAYIFRQFAPRSAKPHMDMVFIPNIGIVEERAGFTLDEALSNAIKLNTINGVPLETKIQVMCNQQSATGGNQVVLSPYGSDVTPGTVYQESPDMAIKSPTANTAAPATSASLSERTYAAPVTHKIVKGETLYRLSKEYGVSVGQLKEWNNLKSNTIYAGHQLIVSDPANTAPSAASNTVESSMSPRNTGNNMPAPYGANGQRLNVTAKGGNSTQEFHTVRTGETVASIAMKYGYTEEKFREMNALQPNEYPKIGQRLKTNDCDCPEGPVNNTNALTPRGINPYAPNTTTTNNSLYSDVTPSSTPVNNYSYPSPSSYDESRQNPNTRPFSSYSDTPVPATGSLTAPSNYNNTNAASPQSYDYTNFSNTSTRGVSSYDNTSSGMKRSHIVKDGEDLYSIARQYGTTVNILRQLNRLDANEVVIPNQKIYLE